MPINKKTCLPFRDTFAAPGSDMHKALSEGNYAKANEIYETDERQQDEWARLRALHAQNRSRMREGRVREPSPRDSSGSR